jgi:hypothetical protein
VRCLQLASSASPFSCSPPPPQSHHPTTAYNAFRRTVKSCERGVRRSRISHRHPSHLPNT